jgi:RNA polymerase sigma-70 factor (ECF subfamily)
MEKATSSLEPRVVASEPACIDVQSSAVSHAPQSTEQAATRLFVEHGRFVLRVLLRMGVAEQDAQDVCQEVFLTAFRKHDQFLGASRETTWLYGICLRLASNHRRKGQRRREQLIADAAHVEATPRDHDIDAQRLLQKLDAALSRLADKKREVFVLFEFAERDMDEIAEIVSVPVKTCYSRLYAARAELRADIELQCAREVK